MQRHGRIHCGRRELNLQMIGSTVCNPSCFIYDKPLHVRAYLFRMTFTLLQMRIVLLTCTAANWQLDLTLHTPPVTGILLCSQK